MQQGRDKTLFTKTRQVGSQLIPYEDNVGGGRRIFGNRQDYDSSGTNQNQIALYDNFKLSLLKAKTATQIQNIIADTPIVRACLEKYTSTCSTAPLVEGGSQVARDLAKRFIEDDKFKIATDQAFNMLFKRGGFVLEGKYLDHNGVVVPQEIKVHDFDRFTYELVRDPQYVGGEKYALMLKNYLWNRPLANKDLLDSPNIKAVAKSPEPGKKPYGRSRITSAVYMAAVQVKIVDAMKNIFAKSGNPTLTAKAVPQNLFGGADDSIEFFGDSDPVAYLKKEIEQFSEQAKKLPEGDVLIAPNTIEIGEYLNPGTKINVQGLDDFAHSLKIDICLGLEVPPAAIGIIQKSGSLNDTHTQDLILDFRNDCHQDQILVASAFQSLMQYTAERNGVRTIGTRPFTFAFEFSNPEAILKQYALQKEKSETEAGIIANIKEAVESGVITQEEAKKRYLLEVEALNAKL